MGMVNGLSKIGLHVGANPWGLEEGIEIKGHDSGAWLQCCNRAVMGGLDVFTRWDGPLSCPRWILYPECQFGRKRQAVSRIEPSRAKGLQILYLSGAVVKQIVSFPP